MALFNQQNAGVKFSVYRAMQWGFLCLFLINCDSALNGAHRSSDYFPLDKGVKWVYRVETTLTGSEPIKSTLNIENLGEQSFQEHDYKVRRTSAGTDYFLGQQDNGIYRYAKRSLVETKPVKDAHPRLVLPLPIPKKPGKSWSVLTQSFTIHRVMPNYEPPYENVAHFYMTYSLLRLDEEVTVPAGHFKNCLLVEGQAQVDQFAGANEGTGEIEITTREWYAPGVGLIKLERHEPLDGSVFKGGSIVMELESISGV